MIIAVEPVVNLVQTRHDGTVILGAEHHYVDGLRIQINPVHDLREQRIPGQDIPFPEAVQKPLAVVLDGIRPSPGIQNHTNKIWGSQIYQSTDNSNPSEMQDEIFLSISSALL